jgi:hypothetical protein
MPFFPATESQEFRIVYWGSESAGLTQSLDAIAETSNPDECCSRTRFPTSLDPASCYEKLSLQFGYPAPGRPVFNLIAAPSAPELAPVRVQLLDRADAIVLLVDMTPGSQQHDAMHLAELRSALAAYGRRLDDLPLAVQYTGPGWVEPTDVEQLLREYEIAPVAVHEAIHDTKTSFREVLQGLARVLESPNTTSSTFLAAESATIQLAQEDDPWLTPPDAHPSEDESAISAMLEASILEESEGGDALPIGAVGAFFEVNRTEAGDSPEESTFKSIQASPSSDFEIASVGIAVRTGSRGIRIPLALSSPEGESVPLTLHIEVEAPSGEREP